MLQTAFSGHLSTQPAATNPQRAKPPRSPAANRTPQSGSAPLPPGDIDLRRRYTRDVADRLVARSIWLAPSDRTLIQCVFRDGLSAAKVAEMRREPVRLLRRRIRQLIARIGSPEFEFVVRRRDAWPAQRRRIATEVVLHGNTIKRAADFLRLSFHEVRKEVAVIRAMSDSAA